MSRLGRTLAVLLLLTGAAGGQPTFNRDIAPIVWNRCAGCHRPGQAGPFSLVTFADVATRSRLISDVVRSGYMPPWPPSSARGTFEGDRRLTEGKRETLLAWLESDLDEGVAAGASLAPPKWPKERWQLGKPDLVVEMPETFELAADGSDVFRNFVIPIPVERRRYVRGFEFRPGNARLVHHARLLFDRSGRSATQDRADPGPGFGGGMALDAVFDPDGHWIGWTPGKQPALRPPNMAWTLEPETDLVLELHMVPTGKPESIRSSLALYFTDEAPTIRPLTLRLGKNTIDIPAGEANYLTEDSFALPVDVTVLNVYAHAHYLGKSVTARATLPDGSEQPLLHIADWNFDWQDEYRYSSPIRLNKGSELRMEIRYDNSAGNPRNPNHPPRRVTHGWKTSEEMGDVWFQVVADSPNERALLAEIFERKESASQIAGLEKQLEMTPGDPQKRNDLGYRYLEAGRVEAAVEQFEQVVGADDADSFALHNLGVAWGLKRKTDRAIEYYRRAISADPTHGPSRNNLGLLLAGSGRRVEAERELRQAIEVAPRFADAYANLGALLASSDRVLEAIEIYQSALKIAPDFGPIHFNLAGLLRASGNIEGARRHYKAAAADDYPEAASLAKQALEELGRVEK